MADVFFSYSHYDARFVQGIHDALNKEGISCFDPNQSSFHALNRIVYITKQIEDSKIFLLLLSRQTEHSEFVMNELHIAYSSHSPVILPVRLEELEMSDLDDSLFYYLSRYQIFDGSNLQDKERMQGLVRVIAQQFEKTKPDYGFAEKNVSKHKVIAAGEDHAIALRKDGCVLAAGDNQCGQCNIWRWRNIVSVAAGAWHTVGLCLDGTVVSVGFNRDGRCNVENWTDITAVAAGFFHTVGLRTDGTVVAVGDNDSRQCRVRQWSGVKEIAAGFRHTVALFSDGHVEAMGGDDNGVCRVKDWKKICSVAAGGLHTVGLRSDGTVITTVGSNSFKQSEVEGWENITAIAAGNSHTVGLCDDGRVYATGRNKDDVESWRNIVAIAAGGNSTLGLQSDGKILIAGKNKSKYAFLSRKSDNNQETEHI